MDWIVSEMEWCSSAVLPEKIGVDEMDLTTLEDKSCDSVEDALALIQGQAVASGVVAVKATIPKLPADIAKAIEKLKAKIPEMAEKLKALLRLDPESGEETWRQQMQQEIVERNQKVKVESRSCKGCSSKIATAHIRTYLCPVCLTFPFLETETDRTAFAKQEDRIKTLKAELDEAQQRITTLQAEGASQSEDLKRVWLVFRKAA